MKRTHFVNKVPKLWGSEEWIVNKHYCGKFLNILGGHQTSLHYHKDKSETFYVLRGTLIIDDGKKSVVLREGEMFDIVPYQIHRATALTDAKLLEISAHHEDTDSHRLVEGGKVQQEHSLSGMRAVILCGGAGTRLRPLTYEIPKVMIPVHGKPMLEHFFDLLKKYGIYDVTLSVGHMKEKIKDFFMDGSRFGMRVQYLEEEQPLGTAGGLYYVKDSFKNSFIVINGDNLQNINIDDMLAFHIKEKSLATLALTEVSEPEHYGVARLQDSKILEFIEKPPREQAPSHFINAGFYILEPEVLQYIPKGFAMFEKDVFPVLAKQGRLSGYKFSDQWFDTGTFERYEKVINEWKGIV